MRRLLIGAVVTVALAVTSGVNGTSTIAGQEQQGNGKRYKATRAFVVDKDTGAVRMPTQEEVDQVVANLAHFGQKSDENLPTATAADGAEMVDLQEGFSGIVLARPAGDGTWETRCVFTVEEGAEFLGLVVDESIR